MATNVQDVPFDLSLVKLSETDGWCYHEGSYGHNPEYGSSHILTYGNVTDHTKTDFESGSNFRKSGVLEVQTFWQIQTTGESMVPKDISATGQIGHTHSVSLDGDTLTVKVNYNEKGESKTTILSVTDLYRQSNNGKTKLDFKYGDLGHKYLIKK